jgi:polyhydroxyalkanoate synthesis regulator protein
MSNVVIIKKYANNKLYISRGNTESVGYINLTGVINIIRKGKDVKVIDQVSGEDITIQTLKSTLDFISVSLDRLVEVIRA